MHHLARPIKNGVDYFPLDVNLEDNICLIEAEFGLTGFALVVKLYQKIYSLGYYCEWNDEVALLFGRETGLGGKAVSEIVSASIRRGIFNKELYEKYRVLTSNGIQKRYFEIVSRRKSVDVDKRYLLINVTNLQNCVDINPENVYINPENVNNNTQSKVKESKGKESSSSHSCSGGFGTDDDVLSYFESMDAVKAAWVALGSPWSDAKDGDIANSLIADYTADWVLEAIAISAEGKERTWRYVRGILRKFGEQKCPDSQMKKRKAQTAEEEYRE